MSLLKSGFLALNPASQRVADTPSTGDGYSNIADLFGAREAACREIVHGIDDAIAELNRPITVSMEEVEALIDQVCDMAEQGCVEDSILKPVFASVIDGAIRSFKVTSRIGLTPSQIIEECERFSYAEDDFVRNSSDSLTEYTHEQHEINAYGETRKIDAKDLRDSKKMCERKKRHFDGKNEAEDEYGGKRICISNDCAFEKYGIQPAGKERHPESAEVDHVEPCKRICENMKKNKALSDCDIKEIANCDENLAVTSRDTNNAKRADTNSEFVSKHEEELSSVEKESLLSKEKAARKGIENKQNSLALNNLVHDKGTQKKFAADAGASALGQTGGVLILYIIKPIYYEMKDSIRSGLESGVGVNDFKEALRIRFGRVKDYILNSLPGQLASSALSFLKSFVSTLIEALIGVLAGVFRMLWRLVKEGFKIITGAVSILKDSSKSFAEKGDAILQLASISVAAVAGVYIDGACNNLGIPEPWSILLASIASAVVVSGMLYVLNQVDVFHVKRDMRRRRIREIFEEMNAQIDRESKEHEIAREYAYITA